MAYKVWLASELAITILFYYAAYFIVLVVLGKAEPWIETNTGFHIFSGTYLFLYATTRLTNFVMSLAKGETDAFFNRLTGTWFSVHKLLKKETKDG